MMNWYKMQKDWKLSELSFTCVLPHTHNLTRTKDVYAYSPSSDPKNLRLWSVVPMCLCLQADNSESVDFICKNLKFIEWGPVI